MARLDHPSPASLVRLRARGTEPSANLVLERLEGPRLSTLVRRYGPLPVEQLVPLAVQISAVLHYMSAEGFVHLDMKPSNVVDDVRRRA